MGVHCANDETVGKKNRLSCPLPAGASKDSHRQRSPRQRCQAPFMDASEAPGRFARSVD